MSKKKLSGKALVIQITREETRIALMRLGQANPEIQASIILPTPAGAMEDGEVRNLTALKDILCPALEDPVFRRVRRAVFVLCSSRVISETARLPAMKKGKRLEQILQANMDEYFPTVQTEEYLLTWEHAGYRVDGALRESVVQLWAVPRAMVSRYYELAAGLGLTVASIDYCGNAAAAAVSATFAAAARAVKAPKAPKPSKAGKKIGKKKRSGDDEAAVAVMEPPAEELAPAAAESPVLYLHIDDDSIITTFVSGGQVKLQRLVQRGFSLENDLGETAISLEYFNALPDTPAPVGRAVLSGSAVGEAEEWNLRDLLGIPTQTLDCLPDPSWALVLGASRTKLDFGIPELSRDGSETKLWQFVLVFAGGAALMGVVLLYMTSTLTWSTELSGLRNSQSQLMVLAQQNSGAAQAYNEYSGIYDAYAGDWETVYGSLRTYNDNLELLLTELEGKLPTSATVTTFNMTDQSISAQVAFQDKEDVAYFIQSLREMRYANLDGISSLSIGPYYTKEALQAQQAQQQQSSDSAAALAGLLTSGALSGSSSGLDASRLASLLALTGMGESAPTKGGDPVQELMEAPPTKGSNEDMLSYLLQMAGGSGLNKDDLTMDKVLPLLVKANGGEPLSMDDIRRYSAMMDAVQSGNYDQINAKDLADVLSALDDNRDYSESDIQMLLNLLNAANGGSSNNGGSSSGGGSGTNGSYTKDDVKDMAEAAGGKDLTDEELKDLMDALNGSSSKSTVLKQLLESQNITVKQLRLNLQNLNKTQLNTLQSNYASTKDATRYDTEDLEDFIDDASREERADAIESLLHNDASKMKDDPAAMYRFFLLLREDKERSTRKQLLYGQIEDDILENPDMHRMLYASDQKMLDKQLDGLITILTKNKTNLEATEALIMSDSKLAAKYAAHLAKELGKIKTVDTSVDMEAILDDLGSGAILNKSASVQDAVLALLPDSTRALYLAAASNNGSSGTGNGNTGNGNTGNGSDPFGGLNIGDIFGQGQQQTIPAELRYYITVSMSYDESLIQAELARKGLDYGAKVSKLEVSR